MALYLKCYIIPRTYFYKMHSPWYRICFISFPTGFITNGGCVTHGIVLVEGAVEAGHALSSLGGTKKWRGLPTIQELSARTS